jgi:hypothetical protein
VVQNSPKKKAASAKVTDIHQAKAPHRVKPKSDIAYFDFMLPDGEDVYRIPLLQFLTLEEVQRLENEDTIASVMEIFGQDEKVIAAVSSLNGEQLDDLMSAWRDASALGLGE